MLNIVAASLSGVANLCLAGVFLALWWYERSSRFNLAWAGSFAALGFATTALIAHREFDLFGLFVIAIIGVGAAAGMLFAGTRLYLGRAVTWMQLGVWTVAAWAALALALTQGVAAANIVGSVLLALLYGWIGLIFAARPGIERFVGGFFLARAVLAASYPVLAPPLLVPAFITMHFLILATGLALMLAAFARTRKQLVAAEREGRERAAQIDALYNDTPALLSVLDGGGYYITASNDWLAFMGFERQEIVGRHRLSFASPEVQERVAAELVPQLRRDRRVDDFEHEVTRKDGSTALLRTSLRAHRNPITGRFEVIALSVDQTAQRQAEENARRTQHLLERIVAVLPAAVSVKDTELRFVLWNAYAAQLYALSAEQVIGRRLNEIRESRMSTAMESEDLQVLRGEIPPPHEALLEAGGEQRWILMSKTPLLSESGAVEGVISASLDITELKRIQTELQQSREYLVRAQRLGRMGYVRSEYRTGRIYWSETMFELRGLPWREYFTTEEGMAFVHPEDIAAYTAARDAAIAEKREFQVEVRVNRPDGRLQWEQAIGHPQFDASGECTGLLLVVQVTTERKLAEIALRASEARFAGAFHGSTDMMALMRADNGAFVEVNDAWLQGSGYGRDEVIGRRADELNTWVDRDQLEDVRGRMAADGGVRIVVANMRRKDGAVREVRMSGTRIGVGADAYYFWVGRDVTDERAATRRIAALNTENEAALRQIRSIADNVPVLIAHADRDRRFRFVNRTGEQWFDRPASELVGKSLTEVMGEGWTRDSADVVAEVLAGRTMTIERRIDYPDGKQRDVEIVYVPDVAADGKVEGYYSLVSDITERRATEEQLRHAQRMEAIGKLTGGVAHDFNNLLGVISGNLELADESIGTEGELRRMIRTALRATERGATLTRSLLAYARQQPLMPQVVDVNGLVREMADLLRRTVPESIRIEVVADAGLWRCEADPGQLQNALLNLVVNARDAMPEGGRLTIESGNAKLDDDYAAVHAELEPGQYVMLAVSDTGIGMPPDVIARAFDPFFTTKEVGKGTGLGLSMVYGFAKQSRGHVRIYSEVGQGTTVRLYLPRALDKAEPAAPVPEIQPARGETVLLVEDNQDFRTLTFALLRSFGYAVLEANDAESALRILERHGEVALLLTDVVLPGAMNGKRLAEQASQVRPHLRVLYMSGYTENAILHHGRLDPGVHLLQKPFRKRDLAAKVRAALDEGRAA
ncbi:PAS domain S-box protein [Desertibaculum subflavum]|uniref:PAS domain S-box protein n=1 Tax=Desertibaculum subflavum TaxID=2268458 RepID=UPI000E67466D